MNDTVSISEPPVSAEDLAVSGHWEGDLIKSYIATLAERRTRYIILAKIKKKDADTVAERINECVALTG